MTAEWSSVFWLLVVIAAIPVTLWFVRRSPLSQVPPPGCARQVAVLPLSTSQRLVTVEVGRGENRMWMVLGVTPGGISNLCTMAPQDDGSAALPSPAATLEPLLQRLRKASKGDDAA